MSAKTPNLSILGLVIAGRSPMGDNVAQAMNANDSQAAKVKNRSSMASFIDEHY